MSVSRPYCYLSMDSVTEGVGASQVVRYAEALASRGVPVELHTFEKLPPSETARARARDAGIVWRPHPFGRSGSLGGLGRVARAAMAIRGKPFVHARSDMAALAAVIARTPNWIWDVRSFWIDQRIALGTAKPDSLSERFFRKVEKMAASRSSAIVVLAATAVPVLESRFGAAVRSKVSVIPTCVDLDLFTSSPLPPMPLRVLMTGTYNTYYDVPMMLELVRHLKGLGPTEFVYAGPRHGPWISEILAQADEALELTHDEMPALIRSCHLGLAVCRVDAGISLKASMPTKIAEFLASGRPVVVNRGLGDMDSLLEDGLAGVLASSETETSQMARRLITIVSSGDTPDHCRALAERHFNLAAAVETLIRRFG
jgi:glycosyltransferase involved in cell wall biosynthesis